MSRRAIIRNRFFIFFSLRFDFDWLISLFLSLWALLLFVSWVGRVQTRPLYGRLHEVRVSLIEFNEHIWPIVAVSTHQLRNIRWRSLIVSILQGLLIKFIGIFHWIVSFKGLYFLEWVECLLECLLRYNAILKVLTWSTHIVVITHLLFHVIIKP